MVPYIENEYFCIDEESAFANLFNFLVKEMILVSSKKLKKGFENLRINDVFLRSDFLPGTDCRFHRMEIQSLSLASLF